MKHGGFWHGQVAPIRNRLLSGFLVIVPIAVTLFVLNLAFRATVGTVATAIDAFLNGFPRTVVYILSVGILFGVLYFAGLLASFVIGRKAIAMGERLVEMIPVAKTVYSASKQVIQLISRDTEETPRTTALVDFPAPGIKAFGFVTGRIRMPDGRMWIKVFIPTTPNPTTGFLQIVPEERCTLLDMSTEDTFGVIMSAGVLAPPDLTPHILSHAPTPPADDAPRDDGPAPDMELLNP